MSEFWKISVSSTRVKSICLEMLRRAEVHIVCAHRWFKIELFGRRSACSVTCCIFRRCPKLMKTQFHARPLFSDFRNELLAMLHLPQEPNHHCLSLIFSALIIFAH